MTGVQTCALPIWTVEADETFIGGKARFMHAGKRARTIRGRGPVGKAIVFGLLDRETGKVHTSVVGTRRKHHLHREIRENVAPGAELMTDALKSTMDWTRSTRTK